MNLKRFECFVAVAEELHFGRAALRLNMSQPPVSLQIKSLERELGVRLFERTNNSVRLTLAGEAFLPEARAVLECSARALETALKADRGDIGRLSLGFVNPAMDGFLSRAVRKFRQERPNVVLKLLELSSREQLRAIGAGLLHAGFVRHGWLDYGDLEHCVVKREEYVLALPEGHELAGKKRLELGRLGQLPLIMYPRGSQPGLYDAMISAFRNAGVTPDIVQEAASKHTTLSLVAAGLGGALVPRSTSVWRREHVRFIPVEGALPEVEIAAVWPKAFRKSVARLVQLCRD